MPPTHGWTPRLRVGGDAGAGEVVVLRLSGPLAEHASSVVVPFLLPDTPGGGVVARRRARGSRAGSVGPVGDSADHRCHQRCRPAGGDQEPAAGLHRRRHRSGLEPHHLLARAARPRRIDQPPHEPITSALVSGLKTEPALDILAGWLASRDRRSRPARGRRAQSRTGAPDRDHHAEPAAGGRDRDAEPHRPGPTRWSRWRAGTTRECLAEDLRRLDADEIYFAALEGIDKVEYV